MKTSNDLKSRLPLGWLILLAILAAFLPGTSRAQSGEQNFQSLCANCHKTDWTRTVGPGLAGLRDRRPDDWIKQWVTNSKALIATGDKDAVAIYGEFNKIDMPAFPQLDDAAISDLIAYIDAEGKKAGPKPVATIAGAGAGPAAGPNTYNPVATLLSDLTTWAALILIILAFVAVRIRTKTLELSQANGQFDPPHAGQMLGFRFLMQLIAASAIIYLLVKAFQAQIPAFNAILLGALPYAAILTFLIGTLQRYRNRGFTVSSLSSQFLEGKQLFWGSQPFHWGLVLLFFGHLIAFLFPRALMAWNGMPVRLLILEVSSFVFGLGALIGLFTLIYRRFASGRLIVVASPADMLVYTTLLIQILSGLGIAFFVRWGSSWFAGVLTPYLRSIFTLSPDYEALAAMPWVVKLHIVSAFFIIAIIPYTRFMHFLVAPIDYLWRRYQIVVWNYNNREIRNSTRHTYGRKSRNH